mgnify:FL=1
MENLDSRERFDVKIKTKKINIDIKKLSKQTALDLVNGILKDNPQDDYIKENLPSIIDNFGFMGTSQGENQISISGYMPRIETEEIQTCQRRIKDFGPWERKENLDKWIMIGDDKCCSFCGSMHPDRVIELIKLNGLEVVEPSTKQYKWYIKQKNVPNASYGGIKYYRYHDTPEFIKEYNELVELTKNNN